MKPKSYSVCKPIKGICKSYGIWANDGCITAPLVYLLRPKWIKGDDSWQTIVNAIRLELPAGVTICDSKED